jgi:hypothetical protein
MADRPDIANRIVIGIQGNPVAVQPPADGDVYVWSAQAGAFVPTPASGGGGSGAVGPANTVQVSLDGTGPFAAGPFTATLDTTFPNGVVNASLLHADGGTADQDAVITPKGQGAFSLTLPDGTAAGGNKRGINAVDLQIFPVGSKLSDTQVASGNRSFAVGLGNTASGVGAISIGVNPSGTASNNVASGDGSIIIGYNAIADGVGCIVIGNGTASGANSVAINGDALGSASFAVGGTASGISSVTFGCTSSGNQSFSVGDVNVADGLNTFVIGYLGTPRGVTTKQVYASGFDGQGQGNAQTGALSLTIETTDGTMTVLTSDSGARTPVATNQNLIPDNTTYGFRGFMVAREGATADSSYWKFEGVIKRDTGAATTAVLAATVTLIAQDAGAAAWTFAATADTTNGCLQISATGEAAKTIRWMARVYTEELLF